MDPVAEVLAKHYQKTYELTYEHWRQRNRIFLVLLALIAVAALLIVSPSGGHPLVLRAFLKYLDVTSPQQIQEMERTFPFQLVDSIVLLGVFYLMVNLYHRANTVLRSYAYLGALEDEIRVRLSLDSESVSFSREGRFYKARRSWSSKTVKYAYVLLLGLLLVAFIYERLQYDYNQSSHIFLCVFDVLTSFFTLAYYVLYAESSIHWERREVKAAAVKAREV